MTNKNITAAKATMYVYPWDLQDEGIESALSNIKNCNISGIQIAVSYHIATFLLPHNPKRVAYYGNHGAVYFRPDETIYGRTNMMPEISDIVSGPEYLPDILTAARKCQLDVTAWVVYCYNHNLASKNPQLSKISIFGDTDNAQLCVANPEIREYAIALSMDILKNYQFDGFLVESLNYLPFGYGFLNPKLSIRLPREIHTLMGLCFCEHCTRTAKDKGVDVSNLFKHLQTWLREYLNRLPDGITEGNDRFVLGNQVFAKELLKYINARTVTATSLLKEVLTLAHESGKHVSYANAVDCDKDVHGVLINSVKTLIDEVSIGITPITTFNELMGKQKMVYEKFSKKTIIYALFQPADYDNIKAFLKTIKLVLNSGINHFSFYNYGTMSKRQLEWVAEASKYYV